MIKTKWKYLLACILLAFSVLAGGCSLSLSTEGGEDSTKVDFHYEADTSIGLQPTESDSNENSTQSESPVEANQIKEEGTYTSKEEVATYLHEFGHLPDNFITKKEAKELGWDSKEGNLSEVAPGKSIGGDRFGNYEGILPKKDGRTYQECDINSDGGYRGAERIVYSNDGYIYYTEDHYKTFELLYGEE